VRAAHPTKLAIASPNNDSTSGQSTHLRRRYFCCLSGAVGEQCLSYAVIQIWHEGSSEFLLDARQVAEIAATKKQKQKAARRVRLFWLLFWRSKKVTSRRATPGTLIQRLLMQSR
jgi:hypothetical protein